jgi:hypothetical protein
VSFWIPFCNFELARSTIERFAISPSQADAVVVERAYDVELVPVSLHSIEAVFPAHGFASSNGGLDLVKIHFELLGLRMLQLQSIGGGVEGSDGQCA